MTFKIHFELPDGTEGFIVISGDTVDEIQKKAKAELAKRGGKNFWSQEVP